MSLHCAHLPSAHLVLVLFLCMFELCFIEFRQNLCCANNTGVQHICTAKTIGSNCLHHRPCFP